MPDKAYTNLSLLGGLLNRGDIVMLITPVDNEAPEGRMITRKQVHSRLKEAIEAGIPVTNYGMAIAWTKGIYERAIQPFGSVEV